jgi:hypothetical protein
VNGDRPALSLSKGNRFAVSFETQFGEEVVIERVVIGEGSTLRIVGFVYYRPSPLTPKGGHLLPSWEVMSIWLPL